jgi:16S rRNA (adenine1518-N6/adenine1519-N6)-dimethyltransferase
MARRIAQLASVGPGSRVLEVGAGLGSLTLALAMTGAEVVAVEVDTRLLPALEEAVSGLDSVRLVFKDAMAADWSEVLGTAQGPWVMAANLPYNVAVPIVMRALETEPRLERFLIMVQKEVGERLAAAPGDDAYGAVSVRLAYWAEAALKKRVSRTVFWPQPNVDSVLISLVRRPPPVSISREALWRMIEVSFEQRRKTMRGALVRLGLSPEDAARTLGLCGIDPRTRPERLGLESFACLAALAMGDGRSRP